MAQARACQEGAQCSCHKQLAILYLAANTEKALALLLRRQRRQRQSTLPDTTRRSAQNSYRSVNCTLRGLFTVPKLVPSVPSCKPVSGLVNTCRLKALK